jgi:hypothetical protein
MVKNMIFPFFGNGAEPVDWISTLLPIICCVVMLPMLMRGGGDQTGQAPSRESDVWYTVQNIDEAYEVIGKEVDSWRVKAEEEDAKPKSFIQRLRSRSPKGPRFDVKESIAPRLYTIGDPAVGTINFELTEVEGGGTTVKATYGSTYKSRIVDFKARSPLKIPRVPIGNNCPSCGKSVLREFLVCPYCSQKLIQS